MKTEGPLNPQLYAALETVFGTAPGISRQGDPGEYREHDRKSITSDFFRDPNTREALVTSWGESYTVNCPVCGDTRGRLHVNWLCGNTVIKPGTKKTMLRFGDRLYKCWNEECQKNAPEKLRRFMELVLKGSSEISPEQVEEVMKSAGERLGRPGRERLLSEIEHINLPVPNIPLTSPKCPQEAIMYLQDRKFDPAELSNVYDVVYCPEGAEWDSGVKDDKPYVFYVPRLVIPVIQFSHRVYWQGRRLDGEKKMKYRNPRVSGKSTFLYNFDQALRSEDPVLVEGPTDVWRIGSNAMARLGKSLSREQAGFLRTGWHWCGSLVIVVDGDDPKALQCAQNDCEMLTEMEAFPRGVAVLTLDEGKDPADYTSAEIQTRIRECREEHCVPLPEYLEKLKGRRREPGEAMVDSDNVSPDVEEYDMSDGE